MLRGGVAAVAQDRGVGFVFQHYALFNHMTVARNIAFGLDILSAAKRPSRDAMGQKSFDAELTGSPMFVGSPHGWSGLARRATQMSRPWLPGRFDAMKKVFPSRDIEGQPSSEVVLKFACAPGATVSMRAAAAHAPNGP